nr:glutathione S-transferase [Pharsalia antennata]
MAPKLYYDQVSPPSRAVLMCVKAIGVDVDIIEINVFRGDHHKSDLIKINPLRTVPTLVDNDFVLCDSHAIMAYLVGKYGKDKSLYPEDLQKRAIIDQRLHFDSGVFFARHLRAVVSVLMGAKVVAEEHVKAVNEAYGFLEIFLQDNKYIAGDSLSIADFSILNTITNANVLIPVAENTYPKITTWRNLLKSLPYHEVNQIGMEAFKSAIKSKLM